MKALLIRPPQMSPNMEFPAGPRSGLPLGLLYIASVLEKEGIEVEIFDALVEFDLDYLDLNQKWVHFGSSWEEIKKIIQKSEAEIIGINNPFSTQLKPALKVAALAKEALPESLVVVGGPHASVAPETFLYDSKEIDMVVGGEGEYTMPRIISWIKGQEDVSNIAGVAYRKNGKIKVNPPAPHIQDLDNLPLPAYHLLNMERYFELERLGYSPRVTFSYPGSERAVSVITSRGCPFNCTFCSIHPHMGNRWRFHSAEYVLDHLRYLVSEYGVKHIHFEDDNLTLNKKRFETLLDGLLEENINITWDTPNGVRADTFDQTLLEKCKASGCTYLVVGVESGDQFTLNSIIKKKLDLKTVGRVAQDCKTVGIDLHAFFIIGFPGEKKKNLKATLEYALDLKKKFNVFPHLNLAYPQIGTELFKICEEKGYLTAPLNPKTYSNWRGDKLERLMIETEDFKVKDLYELSNSFHRTLARISFLHSVGFLVRNPKVFLFILATFFRKFRKHPFKIKSVLKNIYSRYLIFENYLKRRVYS